MAVTLKVWLNLGAADAGRCGAGTRTIGGRRGRQNWEKQQRQQWQQRRALPQAAELHKQSVVRESVSRSN